MRPLSFIKKYIPVFTAVALAILAVSGVLYIIAINNVAVADALNLTVGAFLRLLLSSLTVWLPFSLFELLIILSLPLATVFIILTLRRGRTAAARIRAVMSLVGVISLILSSYVFTLGVGYRTTPLADSLGIEDARDVEKEELYSVALRVRDEVNALAAQLDYSSGESVMPHTLGDASAILSESYSDLAEEYPFIKTFDSRVKPVLFSTVMSDAGITGIYGFFTGEANVNVEYPHYEIVYTAAHEMAHQRGIARENEANFAAFLVCIRSSDPYVRYSGYLSMLGYLMNAVYATDKELYSDLWSGLAEGAILDIRASNAVTLKHKDSLLGKINDKLNDRYLKFNGTDGVVTYGYAVRLAVGYYRSLDS